MRADHAGNEANAAQGNERKQNVLDSELADPVADGGRLPNTGEVNAGGKKVPSTGLSIPSIKRLSGTSAEVLSGSFIVLRRR